MNRIALMICTIIFSGTAKAKETVITLGLASNFKDVSTSTSNPFGDYFRNGVNLALAQSSAKLKKQGLSVLTQEFDYGTDAIMAGRMAGEAAKSDVIAVLGYNWSSHALIAAPVHQQLKLPMISPSASADRLGRMGRYVHTACFDNSFMAAGLARIAVERLHTKTVAMVVVSDCAYCRDLADTFKNQFQKLGGQVIAELPVLSTDKNYDISAAKVKAANPDVILVPNQELVSAQIISSILRTGLRRPFLGGDGWGDVGAQFFQILNGQPLTGYSVSHWHPELKDSASRKFITEFRKKFGKNPNDTAVLAYDATKIFVEALIKAKTKDREGLEESLGDMTHYLGVTGEFLFRRDRAPSKSIVLLKNGTDKFDVVGSLQPKAGI
jgi:branched-chain amino acid transport system substrate-binding protein